MKPRYRKLWLVSLGLSLLVAALALIGLQAVLAEGGVGPYARVPEFKPAAPAAGPQIQIAHLAPFASGAGTAVTITLDTTTVVTTNLLYGNATGYVATTAGTHLVEVFHPSSTDPVITASITLTDDTFYTAIAVGDNDNQQLELLLEEDDITSPASGFAKFRIGHLAPFADTLAGTLADVRAQDGTLLVPSSVPYKTISTQQPYTATTYDLKITAPGGYPSLIDPMPVDVADGAILSVFATGDGVNQPLGIYILPSSSNGFFLDRAAAVQLAHLAPFAMDPGTAVTVTINNGDAVLPDVEFADSTGYLPVKAGDTQVQITPAGSPTPAISVTTYLSHAMEYTAIAIGDITNQPLTLTLLMDDNTPPATGFAHIRIGHVAPFSNTLAATLAEVRLQDGTLILPAAVPFGAITPHAPLTATTYDVKLTAPGGAPTLIDPSPFTLMDGDILSILAVGNGTKQPLGVFSLPSGEPGTLLPIITVRLYMPVIFKMAP